MFSADMDYTAGQKYTGIGWCYRTQRGPGIFPYLSLIYINRDMKLAEEVFCLTLDRELVILKN